MSRSASPAPSPRAAARGPSGRSPHRADASPAAASRMVSPQAGAPASPSPPPTMHTAPSPSAQLQQRQLVVPGSGSGAAAGSPGGSRGGSPSSSPRPPRARRGAAFGTREFTVSPSTPGAAHTATAAAAATVAPAPAPTAQQPGGDLASVKESTLLYVWRFIVALKRRVATLVRALQHKGAQVRRLLLSRFPILSRVPPTLLAQVCVRAQKKLFQRKQIVIQQGTVSPWIYLVQMGSLAVMQQSEFVLSMAAGAAASPGSKGPASPGEHGHTGGSGIDSRFESLHLADLIEGDEAGCYGLLRPPSVVLQPGQQLQQHHALNGKKRSAAGGAAGSHDDRKRDSSDSDSDEEHGGGGGRKTRARGGKQSHHHGHAGTASVHEHDHRGGYVQAHTVVAQQPSILYLISSRLFRELLLSAPAVYEEVREELSALHLLRVRRFESWEVGRVRARKVDLLARGTSSRAQAAATVAREGLVQLYHGLPRTMLTLDEQGQPRPEPLLHYILAEAAAKEAAERDGSGGEHAALPVLAHDGGGGPGSGAATGAVSQPLTLSFSAPTRPAPSPVPFVDTRLLAGSRRPFDLHRGLPRPAKHHLNARASTTTGTGNGGGAGSDGHGHGHDDATAVSGICLSQEELAYQRRLRKIQSKVDRKLDARRTREEEKFLEDILAVSSGVQMPVAPLQEEGGAGADASTVAPVSPPSTLSQRKHNMSGGAPTPISTGAPRMRQHLLAPPPLSPSPEPSPSPSPSPAPSSSHYDLGFSPRSPLPSPSPMPASPAPMSPSPCTPSGTAAGDGGAAALRSSMSATAPLPLPLVVHVPATPGSIGTPVAAAGPKSAILPTQHQQLQQQPQQQRNRFVSEPPPEWSEHGGAGTTAGGPRSPTPHMERSASTFYGGPLGPLSSSASASVSASAASSQGAFASLPPSNPSYAHLPTLPAQSLRGLFGLLKEQQSHSSSGGTSGGPALYLMENLAATKQLDALPVLHEREGEGARPPAAAAAAAAGAAGTPATPTLVRGAKGGGASPAREHAHHPLQSGRRPSVLMDLSPASSKLRTTGLETRAAAATAAVQRSPDALSPVAGGVDGAIGVVGAGAGNNLSLFALPAAHSSLHAFPEESWKGLVRVATPPLIPASTEDPRVVQVRSGIERARARVKARSRVTQVGFKEFSKDSKKNGVSASASGATGSGAAVASGAVGTVLVEERKACATTKHRRAATENVGGSVSGANDAPSAGGSLAHAVPSCLGGSILGPPSLAAGPLQPLLDVRQSRLSVLSLFAQTAARERDYTDRMLNRAGERAEQLRRERKKMLHRSEAVRKGTEAEKRLQQAVAGGTAARKAGSRGGSAAGAPPLLLQQHQQDSAVMPIRVALAGISSSDEEEDPDSDGDADAASEAGSETCGGGIIDEEGDQCEGEEGAGADSFGAASASVSGSVAPTSASSGSPAPAARLRRHKNTFSDGALLPVQRGKADCAGEAAALRHDTFLSPHHRRVLGSFGRAVGSSSGSGGSGDFSPTSLLFHGASAVLSLEEQEAERYRARKEHLKRLELLRGNKLKPAPGVDVQTLRSQLQQQQQQGQPAPHQRNQGLEQGHDQYPAPSSGAEPESKQQLQPCPAPTHPRDPAPAVATASRLQLGKSTSLPSFLEPLGGARQQQPLLSVAASSLSHMLAQSHQSKEQLALPSAVAAFDLVWRARVEADAGGASGDGHSAAARGAGTDPPHEADGPGCVAAAVTATAAHSTAAAPAGRKDPRRHRRTSSSAAGPVRWRSKAARRRLRANRQGRGHSTSARAGARIVTAGRGGTSAIAQRRCGSVTAAAAAQCGQAQ